MRSESTVCLRELAECFSQVVIFSDMYVNEVLSGQCDGKAKPTIIKETPGTAYVDGHNGIGSVSTVCMVKLALIPDSKT